MIRAVLTLAAWAALALPCGGQATGASGQAASVEAQAQADLQHGRAATALQTLEAAAAKDPNAPGLQHTLGLAYYRTGHLLEAKQAFARAIAAQPDDAESVQLEGLTLFRLGQPAAAIPYLQRVQHWLPAANADASHVLGLCYLSVQRLDDARGAFAAEYGLAPGSAAAYLILARMLMVANLPDQAAAAAETALKQSPQIPMAHFVVGEAALYRQQIPQAIAAFEAERAVNPSYAPVYDRLADVYQRVGRYDDAQQSLLRSLALDTSSTDPFILMGKVLLHQNDPQNAALYLQHAEKMDPANFMTHQLLGQAYRGLGDEAKAKAEFDTAEKIHTAGELRLEPVR